MLSHASDLNRFYLHLVDNKETSKLVTLNQALQEELEGSLQDPEFGELIPKLLGGSLVAVKEGGNWLRGEISRSDNGTVTYNKSVQYRLFKSFYVALIDHFLLFNFKLFPTYLPFGA